MQTNSNPNDDEPDFPDGAPPSTPGNPYAPLSFACDMDDLFSEEACQAEAQQAIRDGRSPNALKLSPKPGESFRLRFLPFGIKPRIVSTIGWHLLYRTGRIPCPRHTDEAIGGNPAAQCPLCDVTDELLARWLIPGLVHDYWAYVVVTASDDGDGWVDQELTSIAKPFRIRLEEPVRTELIKAYTTDPKIGDWESGTSFELKTTTEGTRQLKPLKQGPLLGGLDSSFKKRRIRQISSFLGEPHVYTAVPKDGFPEPIFTPLIHDQLTDELNVHLKMLLAYQSAPQRGTEAYWENVTVGSLPDLILPPILNAQPKNKHNRPRK